MFDWLFDWTGTEAEYMPINTVTTPGSPPPETPQSNFGLDFFGGLLEMGQALVAKELEVGFQGDHYLYSPQAGPYGLGVNPALQPFAAGTQAAAEAASTTYGTSFPDTSDKQAAGLLSEWMPYAVLAGVVLTAVLVLRK